jgi:hypothetical protein
LAKMLAPHVREVFRGVTGHWVSLGRVLEWLAKRLRQRGLCGSGRFGYFVGQLNKKPP